MVIINDVVGKLLLILGVGFSGLNAADGAYISLQPKQVLAGKVRKVDAPVGQRPASQVVYVDWKKFTFLLISKMDKLVKEKSVQLL